MSTRNVTREQSRELVDKIKAAAEQILTEAGFEMGKTSSTYGDSFSIKIAAAPLNVNEDGVNVTSDEAVAFKRLHKFYDLPEDALGKTFLTQGKYFQFVGINPRAPKRPFLAKCLADNRTYVFHNTPSIRRLLGAPN